MKFKVWLNSGANIHSKREVIISLENLRISEDEWSQMTEEQRDEVMREVAFERYDWGYLEIE